MQKKKQVLVEAKLEKEEVESKTSEGRRNR